MKSYYLTYLYLLIIIELFALSFHLLIKDNGFLEYFKGTLLVISPFIITLIILHILHKRNLIY